MKNKCPEIELTDLIKSVSNTSSLPTASAEWRGKVLIVEGASGTRDYVYICLKSDSDTYSWEVLGNGGS